MRTEVLKALLPQLDDGFIEKYLVEKPNCRRGPGKRFHTYQSAKAIVLETFATQKFDDLKTYYTLLLGLQPEHKRISLLGGLQLGLIHCCMEIFGLPTGEVLSLEAYRTLDPREQAARIAPVVKTMRNICSELPSPLPYEIQGVLRSERDVLMRLAVTVEAARKSIKLGDPMPSIEEINRLIRAASEPSYIAFLKALEEHELVPFPHALAKSFKQGDM